MSQPARHTKTGQDLVNNLPPSSLNRSTASQPASVDSPEDRPSLSSNHPSTGEPCPPFLNPGHLDDTAMDEDPYFDEGDYGAPYNMEMYSDGNYARDSGRHMNYNHHEALYNHALRYPTHGVPPRGYARYPHHPYPHGPMRYPPGPQPHHPSIRATRYRPGYGPPRNHVASDAGPLRAPTSSSTGPPHSQTLLHELSGGQYWGSSGQYGQEEGNGDGNMLS
ncbi:hypothetical protein C0993_002058 [Termitomyces sp. T159_Od127]|nr:hypothetical protein C0993_002058 [Termitomyces sp. T159_Od127]